MSRIPPTPPPRQFSTPTLNNTQQKPQQPPPQQQQYNPYGQPITTPTGEPQQLKQQWGKITPSSQSTPQLQKPQPNLYPQVSQQSSPQLQKSPDQYNLPYQPSPPLQQQQFSPQLQKVGGQYNQPAGQYNLYGQPQQSQPQQHQQPYTPSQPQQTGQYNQPPGQYGPPQTYPHIQQQQMPYGAPQQHQQMPYGAPYPQTPYGEPPQPQHQIPYGAPQPPMVYSQPPIMMPVGPPYVHSLGVPGALASVNPNVPPAVILGDKLYPPTGSQFITRDPSAVIAKGRLKIRIISAQNLISADANGYSDPYIKIKSTSIESFQATKVIEKNLNPVWEETLFIEVEDVAKEVVMFDVKDRDLVGNDDDIGYFGIDLALLPLGMEVLTTENLNFVKHGSVQICVTAMDFGITNLPPSYVNQYQQYRAGLKGLEKKDFKEIKKDVAAKKRDLGPYIGKTTHNDYKFYHGWIKRKDTARDQAGNVGKGALKVVGYALLLPIMALASS